MAGASGHAGGRGTAACVAILTLATLPWLGAACAEAQSPPSAQIAVVERDQLARMWVEKTTRGGSAPMYPPKMVMAGHVGCINVGFVIEAEGRVGGMRVLRSKIHAPPLTGELKELQASMGRWLQAKRYKPGPRNPGRLPVFSREMIVVFAGEDARGTAPEELALAQECDVGALADHLAGKAPKPAKVGDDIIVLSFSTTRGSTITIP